MDLQLRLFRIKKNVIILVQKKNCQKEYQWKNKNKIHRDGFIYRQEFMYEIRAYY